MVERRRIITLLTDFGNEDHYVAAMKGVILSINPDVQIVDICHTITPQNVLEASYLISRTYHYYPEDAIHVIVVDPGVGSSRKCVGVETSQGVFITPDNGLVSAILDEQKLVRAVELTNPAYHLKDVSRTFHGRDIFAPAAAHLSMGIPLSEFGAEVKSLTKTTLPPFYIGKEMIKGQITHIDHFGNAITQIGKFRWNDEQTISLKTNGPCITLSAADIIIECGDISLSGIYRTYSSVQVGSLLALIDSDGYLEIGINRGNAARTLNLAVGDSVKIRFMNNDS